MLWPTRVNVLSGGGKDKGGNPIPVKDEGSFGGQITPLRSSESVNNTGTVALLWYRLHIEPRGGAKLTTVTGRVVHAGVTYTVQGDVEPWYLNGVLHHHEATVKRT